jgi:hypothetical protein
MGSADAYDRAGKACGALSLALHGALSGRAAAFGFTGTAMGAFLGQRNAQGVKQDGRPCCLTKECYLTNCCRFAFFLLFFRGLPGAERPAPGDF